MLVTVLDKDGNKRQKDCVSFTSAKQFISKQWFELLMQEPSKIYSLIQLENGKEQLIVRVGKSTVRYWNYKNVKEKPEIYSQFTNK